MPDIIQTAEDFSCPSCGKEFFEDDLIELCGEPFNGTIVECKCGKEWDCNILIKITEA